MLGLACRGELVGGSCGLWGCDGMGRDGGAGHGDGDGDGIRIAEGLGAPSWGADLACITCITFFSHSYLPFSSRESEHRHSVFAETSEALRHHCRCDRCHTYESDSDRSDSATM